MDEAKEKALIQIVSGASLARPITAREIRDTMKRVYGFAISARRIAYIARSTRDGKCQTPIFAIKGKNVERRGYYPGKSIDEFDRWIAETTATVKSESETLYNIKRQRARLFESGVQEDVFGGA